MTSVDYNEVIDIQGVKIPFAKEFITPRIERQMRIGSYEIGECNAAREWVRPGDRVLDLGAGVGLVASIIGKIAGVEKIVSIEANPKLLDLIHETHRINEITNVELRNGVVAKATGGTIPFFIRGHFWASSMEPNSRPYAQEIALPAFGLQNLIEELDPNVLIADIEGGEIDVFDNADLSAVRTIIIELHPLVYGNDGQQKLLKYFDAQGFRAEEDYLAGSVWIFNRHPKSPAPRIYTRGVTSPAHSHEDPKFVIPTCMKNEGPYLLEWLAYHKSIGIQDYVVFSNDCTDGTDLMLDRLDEMGVLTHLPNPAIVAQSSYFQPLAMKFAVNIPQVKRADYVIQTDVDEFINIHTGKGYLKDLLKAAGPFHVLSISEVNFCSSGHWDLQDGWVTELFEEHETKTPGHWQARRGVKSIIHGLDNFCQWPVHRPGVYPNTHDQLIWRDGSGTQVPDDFIVKHENGIDRRGRYDLVQIDHHPLRSAQAFLLKKKRGDVAHHRNNVDVHYYRKRALGGQFDRSITRHLPRARTIWDELMQDKILAGLHAEAVAFHKDQIKLVEHSDEMAELRQWIAENYFPDRV